MVGLSPEGWLYPSQEMVYTTVQWGRALGTLEYYRISNVLDEPVIDEQALARVSTIRTDQLRAPDGFDCANCFARVACLGGCHCQYVGQDGVDPRNRFDIARGFCESYRAAMAGVARADDGFAAPRHCEVREACRSNLCA
jgi:radical SAM protein with 4Fe4S-binding SPASM domain